MKRIGNINGIKLYDAICSKENIELAIKNACKDHHKDPAVIRIKDNPEPFIQAVTDILKNETFHYSRFVKKSIFERGKRRELCYTRTFPDRIVQHAVLQVVAPIILETSVRDTYAARKNKGIHKGSMQVRADLRNDPIGTRYALKIDVHHYFPNVNREILFSMLKQKIKCRRTLKIMHTMIFDVPGKSGLPIGLYSSQIFSTFYLSTFDHYCKETLGIKHYYRYMDDVVVLSSNKRTLSKYLYFIKQKLNQYSLSIKENWQVFPVAIRGLDFMGYVMRPTHTLIRKKTKISYIRSCNRIINCIKHHNSITYHMLASIISYEGMLLWCDSYNLMNKYNSVTNNVLEFGADILYIL